MEDQQTKHDTLKKDGALNDLFVVELSEVASPDNPTKEFKLYFDNAD